MTHQHTPGPWVTNGETIHANDMDTGESIAELYVQSQWAGGTRKGNAHLIAAAPDLLAAAQQVLPILMGKGFEDDSAAHRAAWALHDAIDTATNP